LRRAVRVAAIGLVFVALAAMALTGRLFLRQSAPHLGSSRVLEGEYRVVEEAGGDVSHERRARARAR
jgi:hypothetical protein